MKRRCAGMGNVRVQLLDGQPKVGVVPLFSTEHTQNEFVSANEINSVDLEIFLSFGPTK